MTYLALDRQFKFTSRFLNLLPKFHGLLREDPYRHITEFTITCSTMQSKGIAYEQIGLKAFPCSLQDKAKDCILLGPCYIHYME